ncbi:sodium:solute symporter family protein [Desulforhopalus singaporensis]|nr:sodium:solute symporter family protein [Desulforhopalus singaporensis]
MLGMLALGWYASKRIKSSEDYIVAGRGLGLFFCTGTIFATWFGAGTCMGGAGNAYLFGNQGVLFDPWAAGLSLLVVGFAFARLLRRGKFLTAVDMLDKRFGKKMGAISAIVLSIADTGWLASLLVAFGAILHYFTGVSLNTAIVVSTLVVMVYTYMGGMWAVSLTDAVQMVILIISLIIMLIMVWPEAGGFASFFSNEPANFYGINQWSFLPISQAAQHPEYQNAGFFYYVGHKAWFYWAAAWLSLGLGSLPFQTLVQRFLAAKSETVAVRSGYLSALLYVSIGLIPIFLGMIYFRVNPDLSINSALNNILLYMAVDHLPLAVTIIFIIALVAAIMSSADSVILGVSTLCCNNVWRYFRPELTDKDLLKGTKRMVPVVALVALLMALFAKAIFNLMIVVSILGMVSIAIPFVAAWFWKKANHYGAIASAIGGLVGWAAGYFYYLPFTMEANTGVIVEGQVYFEWAMWDAVYIGSIWGVILSIIALVAVSLLTQKIDAPKPLVDADNKPLTVENWIGIPWNNSDKKEDVPDGELESADIAV